MRFVYLSHRAAEDLEEIFCYIARDNAAAAQHMYEKLENKCGLLAMHPKMGQARDEFSIAVRSFGVTPYAIFYRETEDGIEVVRVVHARRDLKNIEMN